MGIACLPHIHFKAVDALDELGQLGKSVVSGVKVGLLPDEQVAQLPHKGISVLIRDHVHGIGDEVDHLLGHLLLGGLWRALWLGLRLRFWCGDRDGGLRRFFPALLSALGRLRLGRRRLFRLGGCLSTLRRRGHRLLLRLGQRRLGLRTDDLNVDELVTGHDKGVGGLLLPHTDDLFPRLPEPGSQTGKIGIAGNQHKAVTAAGIQNIHGIYDHGRVGSVLAGGVAVLLDGSDGVLQKDGLPGGHVRRGPIPINSLYCRGAIDGDLGHHIPHGGP